MKTQDHCTAALYVRGRAALGVAPPAHLADRHVRPCTSLAVHREAQADTSTHSCTPAAHDQLHTLTLIHTCPPCTSVDTHSCAHTCQAVTHANTHTNTDMSGHTACTCVSQHMPQTSCHMHTHARANTDWAPLGAGWRGVQISSNGPSAGARPELCSETPSPHEPLPGPSLQWVMFCDQWLQSLVPAGEGRTWSQEVQVGLFLGIPPPTHS